MPEQETDTRFAAADQQRNESSFEPRISISFTKGSTKDGPLGCHVRVDEGADEAEAERVLALAGRIFIEALAIITPTIKGQTLEEQLEESIAKAKATAKATVDHQFDQAERGGAEIRYGP